MSSTLTGFIESERAGGVILVACTLASLVIANTPWGPQWLAFWQVEAGGLTLEHWVNDALMAVFFLLVGLELEREIYAGELSDLRRALLPIVAAVGGIAVPAAIHYSLNANTPAQPGAGIPMATDIAFALAALSLLGSHVPVSLKVFLTAFAVMDDLAAILVIAVAYTSHLSMAYLLAAAAVFVLMVVLNRMRVMALAPYLIGGVVLWALMLKSGIHATVAGVMLAFAIPFTARIAGAASPSNRLEDSLHKPVAFVILPIFALANTGVVISAGSFATLADANSIGIVAGLVLGKPVGIAVACVLAVAAGLGRKPDDLSWGHIIGAGILGGIGFTMSIFITNLAFANDQSLVNASKLAILLASLAAGGLGVAWLASLRTPPADPLVRAPRVARG